MKKLLSFIFISVLMLSASGAFAQVTCYAITPSTSGSGTGASWTNAHGGIPTLTRGTRYYFADGSYSAYTFSTAVSGTTTIEFRKAQSYDFGRTSDGCSNDISSGFNAGTMGAAQAVFSSGGAAITVSTNFFTMNGNGTSNASGCGGAPGSTVTASPPTPADCGFKLVGTGSETQVISMGFSSSNQTFNYIEILASGVNNTSNFEIFGSNGNFTLTNSYAHNSGTVFIQDLGSNSLVDHSYFWGTEVNCSGSCLAHGQAEYEVGANNNGVRSNNVYRDIAGTAVWTFGQTGTTNNNWQFYNNTILYSSPQASWRPSTSDAALDCINSNTCTNFSFIQNTIINCPNPTTTSLGVSGCGLGWGDATAGSVTIENNLYYGNFSGTIGLTTHSTTVTSDYNSFLNSGTGFGSGTHDVHVTSGSANPFVGWPASNFNLASDNANWNNRLSLSAPYTADVNGNTFTTDRGAYQFGTPTQATQPSCTPGTGTYSSTQTVTCTNPNSGTTDMCFTVNGTTPVTDRSGTACTTGTKYTTTISVSASETLKIVAGTSTLTDSTVASYAYTIGAPETLTVTSTDTSGASGSGTVTSSPAGINCPGTCSASFANGTLVTLTPVAASGSLFINWGVAAPTFQDDFSTGTLNASNWVASNYTTANFAGGGSTVTFAPSNVVLSGGNMQLKLTQPTAGTSSGAEITSVNSFGYGTYEFSMRAGSTSATSSGAGTAQSGQISSSFIIDDPGPSFTSITEIDAPEIEGLSARSNEIEWDTWLNGVSTVPSPAFTVLANPEAAFHLYRFVWSPTSITFYVDGVLTSTSTTNIPTAPAIIDINFYGTNSSTWGGLATTGVTRYMYVNSFKYWATSGCGTSSACTVTMAAAESATANFCQPIAQAYCNNQTAQSSSFSIASNIVTINAPNTFPSGAYVGLSQFTTGTQLNGRILKTNGSTTTSKLVGTLYNVQGTALTLANVSSTADGTGFMQGQGWNPFYTAPFPAPNSGSTCVNGNGDPACVLPTPATGWGPNTWAFDPSAPSNGVYGAPPSVPIVQLADTSSNTGHTSLLPSLAGETNERNISLSDGSTPPNYMYALQHAAGHMDVFSGHIDPTHCAGVPCFVSDVVTAGGNTAEANSYQGPLPLNYGIFSQNPANRPGPHQALRYQLNVSPTCGIFGSPDCSIAPVLQTTTLQYSVGPPNCISAGVGCVTAASTVNTYALNTCPGYAYLTVGNGLGVASQMQIDNVDASLLLSVGNGAQGGINRHNVFVINLANHTCTQEDTAGFTGTNLYILQDTAGHDGTSYAPNDTFSFTEAGGVCSSTGKVVTISGGGATGPVSTIAIVSGAASGCYLGRGFATTATSGSGSGLEVDVTGVGTPGTFITVWPPVGPCTAGNNTTIQSSCATAIVSSTGCPTSPTNPAQIGCKTYGIHNCSMQMDGLISGCSGWGPAGQGCVGCDFVDWQIGTGTLVGVLDATLNGHGARGFAWSGNAANPNYWEAKPMAGTTDATCSNPADCYKLYSLPNNGCFNAPGGSQVHGMQPTTFGDDSQPVYLTSSINSPGSPTQLNPPGFVCAFGQQSFFTVTKPTIPGTNLGIATWYAHWYENTNNANAALGPQENFESYDNIFTCAPDGTFCIVATDMNTNFAGNVGLGLDNVGAAYVGAFSYTLPPASSPPPPTLPAILFTGGILQ